MKVVSVSSKNQVTIPVKMLRAIGLDKTKRAIMEISGGAVQITPISQPITDQVAGSLKQHVSQEKLGKSVKNINKETKKRVAKKLATK